MLTTRTHKSDGECEKPEFENGSMESFFSVCASYYSFFWSSNPWHFRKRKNYEQILTYNRATGNFRVIFHNATAQKKNDESKRFHSVLSILQRISICEVQKLAAHKKNNKNNKICYRGYLSSANGLLKGWTHSKKCMCTLNKHLNSLNASNIYTFSFCTLLCVPNWRNYDGFFFLGLIRCLRLL